VSVFDIALQLWDALRDVLGAVKARAG